MNTDNTLTSLEPNQPKPEAWSRALGLVPCVRADCGRTGGHSSCQTERDWWSGLERWPGVFSYSNGRDGDSWTQYTGLCVCMCAYLSRALYSMCSSIWRCIVFFLKQQEIWKQEESETSRWSQEKWKSKQKLKIKTKFESFLKKPKLFLQPKSTDKTISLKSKTAFLQTTSRRLFNQQNKKCFSENPP